MCIRDRAIFDAWELPRGCTLVLAGDGREFNAAAMQTIVRMAAANGVGRLWVARGGVLSTPAASAVVREREGGVAAGAIVLTASHNPGGLDGDFGIKFNTADGAPAKEALTDAVYAASETIESYKTVDGSADVDLSVEGATEVAGMVVEVIDPVEDHLAVLRRCFDFDAISALLARPDFSLRFDAMHLSLIHI